VDTPVEVESMTGEVDSVSEELPLSSGEGDFVLVDETKVVPIVTEKTEAPLVITETMVEVATCTTGEAVPEGVVVSPTVVWEDGALV
jgi:hypothetical protein